MVSRYWSLRLKNLKKFIFQILILHIMSIHLSFENFGKLRILYLSELIPFGRYKTKIVVGLIIQFVWYSQYFASQTFWCRVSIWCRFRKNMSLSWDLASWRYHTMYYYYHYYYLLVPCEHLMSLQEEHVFELGLGELMLPHIKYLVLLSLLSLLLLSLLCTVWCLMSIWCRFRKNMSLSWDFASWFYHTTYYNYHYYYLLVPCEHLMPFQEEHVFELGLGELMFLMGAAASLTPKWRPLGL